MTPQIQSAVDKRWLRAVWFSTMACMLLIWLTTLYGFLHSAPTGSPVGAVVLSVAVAVPFVAPYGVILSSLKRNKLREGLARAQGMGTAGLLLASLMLFVQIQDVRMLTGGWWLGFAFLALIWAAQVGLVASAVKAYYTAPREGGDRKKLRGALTSGVIFFILWFLLLFAKGSPLPITFD